MPITEPKDSAILVRLTQVEHEALRLAAEQDGRTISGFVRNLVRLSVAPKRRQ